MHRGQWDQLDLWHDHGLLYSGRALAGFCVCVCVRMLSFGAFGVTEVLGLRVLLCEAALHPPAAPYP